MPTKIENIELYNVSEVSQVIGKHENTVRSYCHDGKIKAQKINDAFFVTRQNLESIVHDLNFPLSIIELRLGKHTPSRLVANVNTSNQ